MGLRDLARRLTADRTEIDGQRLRDRFAEFDLQPMNEIGCRSLVRVGGEVKRMRVAPRQGIPALEVVLSDGTADTIAVFTGRRSIGGIEHGRAMVIEGVPRDDRGRHIMLNPAYTLIAS